MFVRSKINFGGKKETTFRGAFFSVLCGLLLSGCGDTQSFDSFLARKEMQEPGNPIHQKQYTSGALSRPELEHLLEMALYRGPAENYGDVVMREDRERYRMDPVVFSHRIHRSKFTCRVCHIELEFSMKKGGTGITREDYLAGLYCGACHNGTIAFSVDYACNLCHVKVDNQGNYQAKNDPALDVRSLPHQDYGDGVNWVEAIRQGAISPRDTISEEGKEENMQLPAHLKKTLRWTTRSPRTLVVFPHDAHIQWLDCANCHPDIFTIEQMGTVEFDKEKNLYGLYCGTCHMTVAFPMNGCGRCHPDQKNRLSDLLD
ncbi:MAG: c(7)-type cytochrome triheme domain-containing protein [Pseudomonadota bacterium]